MDEPPSSIAIIGGGVFGLSTALALLSRPRYANTKITLVEAAGEIPNPSGSSVDASRIVRADYADPLYSRLAAEAQILWRNQNEDGWGGEGRYFQPGFLLTVDSAHGTEYLKSSLGNVQALAEEAERKAGGTGGGVRIEQLDGKDRMRQASGYHNITGLWGYVNWGSGWADAAKVVAWMKERVVAQSAGSVSFKMGMRVEKLLVDGDKVVGAQLQGEKVTADLVILATGAWTAGLIDLRGRALATGQALTYINISPEEEEDMAQRPTIMNMSRGIFIIPPRHGQLKVARHAFGYLNPSRIEGKDILGCEDDKEIEVSLPCNGIDLPKEGQVACREALQELVPGMGNRPFVHTRVCWYCDTPTGDFIIDYYPGKKGLLVATGGSGHGFKFAPVIGEKIVDRIDDSLDAEMRDRWRWRDPQPDFSSCEDGSRAGARGMILKEEMAKS